MTLLQLFCLFFKTAILTFGGGYAMIPLLGEALVPDALSASQMADLVALAQMTPGAVGLNCATYVGFLNRALLGAVVCTFALALPGTILGTLTAMSRQAVKESRLFKACLRGIRPMVIGLIASVVLFFAEDSILTHAIRNLWTPDAEIPGLNWKGLLIFAVCLVLELRFRKNVIWLISTAGILGLALYSW